MTSEKKNFDEMPERRSERSMPPECRNGDDENEKLKKDGSDVDTIQGDLETPEPVPPTTKRR